MDLSFHNGFPRPLWQTAGWWLVTLATTVAVMSAFFVVLPWVSSTAHATLSFLPSPISGAMLFFAGIVLSVIGLGGFIFIPYQMISAEQDAKGLQRFSIIILSMLLTLAPYWGW